MYPDRPTQLDAALLYYDYKPFAYSTLIERIQGTLGDTATVKLGAHQDGSFGVISVDGIIIKVSQNTHALALEGFRAALMSLFTQHTKPNALNIVQNHRKNIFVTVGGDAILMPDFAPGDVSPEIAKLLSDTITPETKPSDTVYANRIALARLTIQHLIDMNEPELVHWIQSDQLLTAREMKHAHDPSGMALQIHPVMTSSGNDKRGKQLIGFDAFGSEHILGHHIVVEETALLFEDVFKATQGFIFAARKSGHIPKCGEITKMASGESYRVHRKPADEKHPRPYLRLEVLSVDTNAKKPRAAAPKQKTTSGFFKFAKIAMGVINKTPNLVVAVVLALVFGKLLGGSDGLEIVSLLGN